jgi:hypothetical protein
MAILTQGIRRTFAGVALAAAATAFTAAPAAAQDKAAITTNPAAVATTKPFTKAQCIGIGENFKAVARSVPTSQEFRKSFVAWLNPATRLCDGPTEIIIIDDPQVSDFSAFRVLNQGLNDASSGEINFTRAGLKPVIRKPGSPSASAETPKFN